MEDTQSPQHTPPAMQAMTQFTHLGRPLDPRYPTNLAIMLFSTGALLLAGALALLAGQTFAAAALKGVLAAAAVFLAWAVGREIDPDHNGSALIAAPLALAAALLAGTPDVLALLILMSAARIVARTTGLAPLLADTLLWVIAAAVAAYLGQWISGLVVAGALLLDALLPAPNRPHGFLGAGAALVVTFAAALLAPPQSLQPVYALPGVLLLIVLTLVVLLTGRMVPPRLVSVGDFTGETLYRERVLAARWLALVTVTGWFFLAGTGGVILLAPAAAALLGIGLDTLRRQLASRRG